MSAPEQTIPLRCAPEYLPALMTRLTTYLLHHQYDFMQTCHDANHADFDVLASPEHPAVRLSLQAASGPTPSFKSLIARHPALPKPLLLLLQYLLQPPASPAQSPPS